MPVHILKLCVGVDSVEQLMDFQARRRREYARAGAAPENIHRTRNFPRRHEEVLEGGSLYWIIRGYIRVRQPIVRFDVLENDHEGKRCGIVLAPDLIRTTLQARRPHQGWRYLEDRDAPADLTVVSGLEEEQAPPPEMAAELRSLGLI
jgi:hypothetical protein